jgi:hypothetical protein
MPLTDSAAEELVRTEPSPQAETIERQSPPDDPVAVGRGIGQTTA